MEEQKILNSDHVVAMYPGDKEDVEDIVKGAKAKIGVHAFYELSKDPLPSVEDAPKENLWMLALLKRINK